MNYLTHFYLNQANPDSEFHFGVALPDLLSVHNRQLRFQSDKARFFAAQSGRPALWDGIQNHLSVDRDFHISPIFKELQAEVHSELMRRIPKVPYRLFFVAHILIEITFDHLLLARNPNLAQNFYSHLEQVPRRGILSELESFFESPIAGLEKHLDRFMEIRFLQGYRESDQLLVPINRMLQRTGQPMTGQEDGKQILETIQNKKTVIQSGLDQWITK